MYIEKREICLTDYIYAYLYTREENVTRIFKKEVKRYIGIIDALVNINFKRLLNSEFYNLIWINN